MPTKRLSLAEMIAKAGDGRGGRSPIYLWLKKNHRQIRTLFDTTGPNWSGLLKVMHQQGVTDRAGKPPALRVTQQHWYRLCKQMTARPPSPAKPPAASCGPEELAPGIRRAAASAITPPAGAAASPATQPDADPLAALLAQINKH